MPRLLAFLAFVAGASAPPSRAPIPRDPAELAARLDATTHDLGGAIDRWRASGRELRNASSAGAQGPMQFIPST